MQMSASGKSRQFVATHQFGRYRSYSGHAASGLASSSWQRWFVHSFGLIDVTSDHSSPSRKSPDQAYVDPSPSMPKKEGRHAK
jgi:hypothetical protein